MTQWFPTRHAVDTMARRGITWQQVLDVLAAPEVRYINTSKQDSKGRGQVNQRGDIFVVTSVTPVPETELFAVITVGLRASDQWTDRDVRNRSSK